MSPDRDIGQDAKDFFANLAKGNFENILEHDEYERFGDFLRETATPARGFVVSFPLADNNLAWGLYEFEELIQRASGNSVSIRPPQFFIPEVGMSNMRDVPDECAAYPIWPLKDNEED